MKLAVDLHIHTALSPCAHEDMTPNNIVNMACLKELDAIAVTDHNSCLNAEAVMMCAKDTNLMVIPGMEVETVEEVHIVCLFETLEDACSAGIIDERDKDPLNEKYSVDTVMNYMMKSSGIPNLLRCDGY